MAGSGEIRQGARRKEKALGGAVSKTAVSVDRMEGEGFHEGFQSIPVDWTIGSVRKRGFFDLLAKVTGSGPHA